MLRERVAEDIFVFTSELYARVTAGVIVTPEGAIVIDTLPFPEETAEMAHFIRHKCPAGARYVINTHHHADHVYGTYQFPEATVISHALCRQILLREGERVLQEAKEATPELVDVKLRYPTVVFDQGQVSVRLGGKTVVLFTTPGHAPDSISAYVKENKVLFAGDAVMPVPYIVNGDRHAMMETLRRIGELPLESIVQGHGEVLLRGEIKEALQTNIAYLEAIENTVRKALREGRPAESLRGLPITKFGKSPIPLNGLVQQLHENNLLYLYDVLKEEEKA